MQHHPGKRTAIAVLVSGGETIGVASFIAALSYEARRAGFRLLGIPYGFASFNTEWLAPRVTTLNPDALHVEDAGTALPIIRYTPTDQELRAGVKALVRRGVGLVVVIGGNGSAVKAARLARCAANKLRVLHVPKTHDDDVALPEGAHSIGFKSVRHYVSEEIVAAHHRFRSRPHNFALMQVRGRDSGHLTLDSYRLTNRSVLAFFPRMWKAGVPLGRLLDVLGLAVLWRYAGHGNGGSKPYGVFLVSEGMADIIERQPQASGGPAPDYVNYGVTRVLAEGLTDWLSEHTRLTELKPGGVQTRVHDLGDVCATVLGKRPVDSDIELAGDLARFAIRLWESGGNWADLDYQAATLYRIGETLGLVELDSLVLPDGGCRTRYVDLQGERYREDVRRMPLPRRRLLEDTSLLESLSRVTGRPTRATPFLGAGPVDPKLAPDDVAAIIERC
ncbi:MAG: 6-phosphofructokinase, partial [Bdellovibrionales bacterium]|nr:6-phosphofructokinase [Bdellovibrionales bacterium]